ncbi:PKD domain-containing protein [Methanosarcina vacuolata]|uniref:Chitin binding protein n=1 Tax=Methanosarcina vacuolata Z-761 TaxID=1434123 RepID=A0A0E3Q395_9EURY|nr:PKD domain-containing protein [Methanosarcina vacuolata]AKB43802.1 Chitin binding protein [Methanosarcina vacuolata Z-761]
MKHILRMFAFIAVVLLIAGVPVAQATVEEGWPVSKPNTPKNADDLFIDFEKGIDGIQIENTIPSLKFTTTSGLNWRYGDIRTGNYNVDPYGSKAYETRGNFFAWLGETGDTGRIDFPGGGATYCSVLVSTYSGVVLDAYNSTGVLIATSGRCGSNLDTGTLTRLTVDAPTGQYISYVLIHDTGNYWLMDDLCTDAKGVIPVPGRSIGKHSDKFDIVFVPDDDYGSSADIDKWLPTFLDDINHQIDERLGGAAPVSGNLSKFNFYYTKLQGTASSKTLPADLTQMSPFADAYVIFHTEEFGDSTRMGPPSIYGAEGPVGRSFIHESGHGIFGLADEYDDDNCITFYFQPNPMPNIWATEAEGRADATKEGWNPDDIQNFTDCQGDWWKLGTKEYIMCDGSFFANGWGAPASRRIQWFLGQYPSDNTKAKASTQSEKSISLNLQISSDVFSLLDDSFVTDSAPSYLPGKYDFTTKVYSTSGELLREYGFNDPRRILAESDYEGPTLLDNVNFQLTLPYFNNGGRVDLIESATGSVKLSVDISKYASTDTTPPSSITNIQSTNGTTWLNWTWTNPSDPDFSHTEIYLNGPFQTNTSAGYFNTTDPQPEKSYTLIRTNPSNPDFSHTEIYLNGPFQTNTSAEYFNATGLQPEKSYTLSTRTVDDSGNVNQTWVNSTGTTKKELVLPVANFSAKPTEGKAPLTVAFTDTSTGDPTKWKWDFGDGTTSIQQNPKHKYSKAGNYTVALTVSNAAGSNTVTKDGYIQVIEKPVANFSASPTSGKAPLNVKFADTSTGTPTYWYWNFGDGSKSYLQNPTHKYSKIGVYTVSLIVKNAAGSSEVTKTNYIKVVTKPVAAFSASPTSGKAPLTVAFTDKSTGLPEKWKWSFGDGTISREQNPEHQYLQEGKYKVTLTVSNAAGSNTVTKTNYITVTTNTRPGIYSENE